MYITKKSINPTANCIQFENAKGLIKKYVIIPESKAVENIFAEETKGTLEVNFLCTKYKEVNKGGSPASNKPIIIPVIPPQGIRIGAIGIPVKR